ncbi:MAG: hypothetical protein CMN05_08025 [Roseibacillus sp.]|jgi:hypothetical protein|nr:hypothetical protein [Roseibacillus sp.]MDP7106286.1 hypothetical protein [Roseibacillus sp.]MDP7497361.1 hypothetical protein [Roseibacillus sp.]|tara:strand:+ start:4321 stop:4719 length:399 start_codon:yes stop_codon:yes gene_type:complete
MRLLLSTSLLLVSLAFFPSCSSLKGKMTKGDIATFKLRDLTRFGQPHLVKVNTGEIKQFDRSELKKGRMASLDSRHRSEPVNFIPPSLPGGSIIFDGSILPPKNTDAPRGGTGPFLGGAAYPTGIPQNFSIE